MSFQQVSVGRPDATLNVQLHGRPGTRAPVFFSHSILSSSAMWRGQVERLQQQGWYVICADTRGHGQSSTTSPQATMETLVADTVAVLDALQLPQVHYVGLSLGGMSGFGLALQHAGRLASLCLCDARADAPPEVALPWNDRIAAAEQHGCQALAGATLERWFGQSFLQAHPATQTWLHEIAAQTSTPGFVACARAIQTLNYLPQVHDIKTPTTLIVGANDGVLPQAMQQLAQRIEGSAYECIADAGHLPNIDQPAAFDAALLRHLARHP